MGGGGGYEKEAAYLTNCIIQGCYNDENKYTAIYELSVMGQ